MYLIVRNWEKATFFFIAIFKFLSRNSDNDPTPKYRPRE